MRIGTKEWDDWQVIINPTISPDYIEHSTAAELVRLSLAHRHVVRATFSTSLLESLRLEKGYSYEIDKEQIVHIEGFLERNNIDTLWRVWLVRYGQHRG
jgi:hypothetical protein